MKSLCSKEYWRFMLGYALCNILRQTHAHGRLMEPPSRSSMWRLGYNTPPNYQDNELFCGGFQNQWETNDGKCGACGDPWQGPRENEAGGTYALGIITRQCKTGSQIPVIVQITAPHRGWFEFRICKNDNVKKAVTKECLDKHLLTVLNGTGSRYHVTFDYPMDYDLIVQLPKGLRCSQCVFQWKYNAGNSWGVDEAGRGCVGCGPQEQFRGCADVVIDDDFTLEDLIPEHKYIPVTMVTNKQPPGGPSVDGNYIDYKDAVNAVKYNRNYRRKWWKSKGWKDKNNDQEEEDDSEAKILFETLFTNGCLGRLQRIEDSRLYIIFVMWITQLVFINLMPIL